MLDNSTKPNILVVNDAPDMLELMRVLLVSENYRVLTATNGREAFEMALAHSLDCVVSDVVMPIMDGIQLCSLLKNNAVTKHIPVLLASAMRTKDQDSLFGLNAGADDYLELPFRQTALLVKVTRLVERARLEKALRASEHRYRTLYQDSPMMYFVLDEDGLIISVNQNGIDRLGYSEEELIGKPVFDIFLAEDCSKVIAQIEKLRQVPGETEHFEARKVDKNGNIVFVSENIRLLARDDDESIFLVICEDITERKNTHDALRESEARYQTVIENAAVAFFALDKNGIFTLFEGGALKNLSIRPGEILGQSVFDVYHDYQSITDAARRALSGESFTAIGDLGEILFETSYSPLYDSNGELSGTVGVATDITERIVAERKTESVINQLGATLEREALINRISNAIRESLRIEDVFSAVVNELGKHLELDRCHLYLFDENVGLVRSVAQFAAPEIPPVSDEEIPFALANRILPAFREQGFVAINDAANNLAIKELYEQVLAPRGVSSIMFVAVRVREGITGLLSLVTTHHQRNWSQADITLACAVADKAGIAIRQAELYQQAQATSQRETLINRLGTAIRSSLQLSEVLHAATHELGEALSASRSYIRFFDSQNASSTAEYVYSAPAIDAPLPPVVNFMMPIGNFILRNSETVVFNDVYTPLPELADMSEYAATVLARRSVRSAVYCPILINNNFRGALCIEQTDRLRRWSESDLTLIEAVASQLSLGISHAELFELTRRAKRDWEATFDAMSDGVFNFDRKGVLQRVNNAGAAMERVSSPRDLIGKNCCDILAVEGEQASDCVVQQVIETRNRITVERLSKQLKRPLLVTAEPLLDESGELTGVVVTGRDLYELRAAEAVARERQSLLSHVLEGILEPIFAVNEMGRIIWCNGATREIYGVEMAEITRRQFTEMIHPEERELAETALTASLKKQPQYFESRYLTEANELRYAIFNSIPLVENNQVNGVLWFVRDITEQKVALQQALQADKLRALGQLASGVAHNFNNVLAAILGRVSLLQRHTNDLSIAQNLKVIQTAAEDAAATVRRIQTFARQSAIPDFSPIELGSLLRDSIELTRTRWQDDAQTRGISYAVNLASNDAFFTYGNASELREVFVNLIVNALDAMPRGGSLEICPHQRNSSVVLEFADEGDGMTDDVRERIFEPFFSTKGVNGTGLGLSVSYSIIKQHNGNITVEPKPGGGGGSLFTVNLPAHDSNQTPTLNSAPPQVKKNLSILVVDDEDYVREALMEMVSELVTTVVGAESGQEALSKLQEQRFDVVFTDLSMPEMDGWDLAENIRRNWGATKTVLVTGYGKGMSLGSEKRELVHAIIGKPFSFAQLSQTLEKIST